MEGYMARIRITPYMGMVLVAALAAACGGAQDASAPPAAPAPVASAAPAAPAQPAAAVEPAKSATAPETKAAAITKVSWGKVDDKEVSLYTLTNATGLVMKVTNY